MLLSKGHCFPSKIVSKAVATVMSARPMIRCRMHADSNKYARQIEVVDVIPSCQQDPDLS